MTNTQTLEQQIQDYPLLSPAKLAELARYECLQQEEAAYKAANTVDPLRDNPERIFRDYLDRQQHQILSTVLSYARENGWNLTSLRFRAESESRCTQLNRVLSALDAMDWKPATAPDLSPAQEDIYETLTNEFQSAVSISKAAGYSEGQVRHHLPNLERMGLAEHTPKKDYRRALASAR